MRNVQGEVHVIVLKVDPSDVCVPFLSQLCLNHKQAILSLAVKRRDFSLMFLVVTWSCQIYPALSS